MNFTKYSKYLYLIGLTTLVSVLFWFSFYTNLPSRLGFPATTLETVFANYDGPNYMIIAKCGYDKACIGTHFTSTTPLEYYPAHLPGFPLIIKFISFYISTPKAMLLASLLGTIFLTLTSYSFFKLFLKEKTSFYLAIFFIFFPARLLVLRLVGAPESWFIATTLLSIILFQRQKYFISALSAAFAMTFKSPGILLFVAYGLIALSELIRTKQFLPVFKKYIYFLIIPLTALLIFYFYYLQTGDFFAYFHSGDNIHLNFLPYLVFISNHAWINTLWLEDIIFIYLIAYIGLFKLYKNYKFSIVFVYPLIYTIAAVFVAHRDISRYIAPAYPFLVLAFASVLTKKPHRLIFYLILPAIILYAINFVIINVAPIANWESFL